MKINVCVGSQCTLMGASRVYDTLEDLRETVLEDELITEEEFELNAVNCLQLCKQEGVEVSPVVEIDGEMIRGATTQEISELVLKRFNKI